MPNQRRFFRPRDAEQGRHQSFRQALDGEYGFRLDQGGQPPLERYHATTRELQQIIAECLRDGVTLRARGSLWSLC
jgi:FAD/FMN-containing dehydrogenase